jgi:ABC-type transporter MlaC component
MTGKPTKFNTTTGRYERFADERAREAYREMFKKRMKQKYGKVHLLDEPDQQKKMLSNRSISSEYK